MKIILILFLTFLIGCSNLFTKPETTQKFDKLSFMLGEWKDNHYGSGLTEIWKRIDDQEFHGQGIVIQNGDTIFSENTYILEMDGNIFYKVVIGKRKPVLFKMTSLTDSEVVFENPEHDNPKKILYRIQPDGSLYAMTEGDEKGQSAKDEFNMVRKK